MRDECFKVMPVAFVVCFFTRFLHVDICPYSYKIKGVSYTDKQCKTDKQCNNKK